MSQPIGAPRPVVEWSSSNPAVVQILSDSLAVALNTGQTVLRATTATAPIDTLRVPIEVIPRLQGRLVWARSLADDAQVGMAVLDLPSHEIRQLPDLGYPGSASGDPYLSFDGERLAATANRPSSPAAPVTVFVFDFVTGLKSSPLDGLNGDQFSAAWLPEDTLLAFLMAAAPGYEIFTIRPDGSGLQQRTTLRQSVPPFFDLTPDGNAILSLRVPAADLFEVSFTGDTVRRLTSTAEEDRYPSVSPDGTQIAYVVAGADGRGHVWLMNRDGTNTRRLLPERYKVVAPDPKRPSNIAQSHDPVWSADGQFVIVAWFIDPYPPASDHLYRVSGEIYAIRVSDGLALRITRSPFTDRQPFFR